MGQGVRQRQRSTSTRPPDVPDSWGKIIAGLTARITGEKSSVPDDEEPQADFPFNTIQSVRIDGSAVDPVEIDAVSAYPRELRESPLVHIGCVTECITGDSGCPGIRLTQMMNQKDS